MNVSEYIVNELSKYKIDTVFAVTVVALCI